MEVNGIAHIFLTASNFQRSRQFYSKLLPFLGLKPVLDTETTYYCVGGRAAVLTPPSVTSEHRTSRERRVSAEGDVDEVAEAHDRRSLQRDPEQFDYHDWCEGGLVRQPRRLSG